MQTILFGDVRRKGNYNKVLNPCFVLLVSGPHSGVRTTAEICKVATTGYLSTKMLMNVSRNAYNAKSKVGCP